jgi:hypothetical protein
MVLTLETSDGANGPLLSAVQREHVMRCSWDDNFFFKGIEKYGCNCFLKCFLFKKI